ncbi:MAG: tryptophan 7-halogenase, partial [Pseudomonadota bacterium]
RKTAREAGVNHIQSSIDHVVRDDDKITAITLKDGRQLSGGVFIDMTGSQALLRRDPASPKGASMTYSAKNQASTDLGPAIRTLQAYSDGWSSSVRVRGQSIGLQVRLDANIRNDKDMFSFQTGGRDKSWIGNCLALGLTAHQILPLTLTPIKLLLKDIQRLLNLIPVSDQMDIEAREYNRSCAEDRLHASLFDDAHYVGVDHPKTNFWEKMIPDQIHPKLDRKIKSFEARGYHVAYDHEAFDDVDWAILHEGLGRMPKTADALTRALDLSKQERRLVQMRGTIAAIVRKMPPHSLYMSKFLDYLERKQGLNG